MEPEAVGEPGGRPPVSAGGPPTPAGPAAQHPREQRGPSGCSRTAASGPDSVLTSPGGALMETEVAEPPF